MKWVLVSSLGLTHEFELDSDDMVQLKVVCREPEIMNKLRSAFGDEVQVELIDND